MGPRVSLRWKEEGGVNNGRTHAGRTWRTWRLHTGRLESTLQPSRCEGTVLTTAAPRRPESCARSGQLVQLQHFLPAGITCEQRDALTFDLPPQLLSLRPPTHRSRPSHHRPNAASLRRALRSSAGSVARRRDGGKQGPLNSSCCGRIKIRFAVLHPVTSCYILLHLAS